VGLIKKVAVGLLAALFFIILIGLLNPAKPRSEQIKEGCEREFAAWGEEKVNQCRLEIMMREMAERETAKTDRAAN
jgi:hypothetical protein